MKKLKPAVVLGAIAAIFLAVYLYVRWKQKKEAAPTSGANNGTTPPPTDTAKKQGVVYSGGAIGPIAAAFN